MSYHQKIQCTVAECTHNSLEDSTCKLDKIHVAPCGGKKSDNPEDETACAMYSYSADLNAEENKASKQY